MIGVRHLVQCRCVLPQFRDRPVPVFHKFPVFSVIDDAENVEVKLAKCDNCGALHRVTDMCRSTIVVGHEDSSAILSVEDIKASIPQRIGDILSSYGVHLSIWEEVQFVYQTNSWGTEIILVKEDIGDVITGKKLRIIGFDEFVVNSFNVNTALS